MRLVSFTICALMCFVHVIYGFHIPSHRHVHPHTQIIGGEEAVPHSAPYTVAMILYTSDGDEDFCGGSIITSNYVLTAAHCLKDYAKIKMMLGVHNWRNASEPHRKEFEISNASFIVHEDCNKRLHNADIGLIKLPETLTFNEHMTNVTLISVNNTKELVGEVARAYGWGLTYYVPDPTLNEVSSVLRYVDVPIIRNQECKQRMPAVYSGNICTSGDNIKGTCLGDSGGPLMLDGYEVGITSYGAWPCESGEPSVYVRVSEYLQWIAKNSDLQLS